MDNIYYSRFKSLWKTLGSISKSQKEFKELISAYGQNHRAYHTFDHIKASFVQFDMASHLADDPISIETAIWFHDIVYDTTSSENEEKSAIIAYELLIESSVSKTTAQKIADLIRITRHDALPATNDEALIIDMDLSIFGQNTQIFDLYEQQIRQEYHWVPEPDYRKARIDILNMFLEKKSVYHTQFFKDIYESRARENLSRSIKILSNRTQ